MRFEVAQHFRGCVARGMRCRKAGIGARLYQCFLELKDGETISEADLNVVLELFRPRSAIRMPRVTRLRCFLSRPGPVQMPPNTKSTAEVIIAEPKPALLIARRYPYFTRLMEHPGQSDQ